MTLLRIDVTLAFGLSSAIAFAVVAGCQTKVESLDPADAGRPTWNGDARVSTSCGDAAAWARLTCEGTMALSCSGGRRGCEYPTFDDAVANCGESLKLAHCPPYRTALEHGLYVDSLYYFDESGHLVADVAIDDCGRSCVAGPTSFEPPACTSLETIACPNDVVDGGTSDSDASAGDATDEQGG